MQHAWINGTETNSFVHTAQASLIKVLASSCSCRPNRTLLLQMLHPVPQVVTCLWGSLSFDQPFWGTAVPAVQTLRGLFHPPPEGEFSEQETGLDDNSLQK